MAELALFGLCAYPFKSLNEFNIKDLQVYGEKTSLHAVDPHTLLRYTSPTRQEPVSLSTTYFDDQLLYLKARLKGEVNDTNDLSSLSNNLIVVEILQAARASAARGERVLLDDK